MTTQTLHLLLGLLNATRLEANDPDLEQRAKVVAAARRELLAAIDADRQERQRAEQAEREAVEAAATAEEERRRFGHVDPPADAPAPEDIEAAS